MAQFSGGREICHERLATSKRSHRPTSLMNCFDGEPGIGDDSAELRGFDFYELLACFGGTGSPASRQSSM
jgi:hypothetical protein